MIVYYYDCAPILCWYSRLMAASSELCCATYQSCSWSDPAVGVAAAAPPRYPRAATAPPPGPGRGAREGYAKGAPP